MGIRDMISDKDTLVYEQQQHKSLHNRKPSRQNKSPRRPCHENSKTSPLPSVSSMNFGIPTALINNELHDGTASEISDVSPSPETTTGRTIGTETLRVILQKIESAKAQLLAPQGMRSSDGELMSVKDQLNIQIETAQLIERLAMAAAALKTMNDVSVGSSTGRSGAGRSGAGKSGTGKSRAGRSRTERGEGGNGEHYNHL